MQGRVAWWNESRSFGRVIEQGTNNQFLALMDGIVPDAYGLRYLQAGEQVTFDASMSRDGHASAVNCVVEERSDCLVPEDYREQCVIRSWLVGAACGWARRAWGVNQLFLSIRNFQDVDDASQVQEGMRIECGLGGRYVRKNGLVSVSAKEIIILPAM
jgi:cold shock CspA family protein